MLDHLDQLDHATVGEIVARDFRAAAIFQRFGIDFCCGGRQSIADAAAAKGVTLPSLVAELQQLDTPSTSPVEQGSCADLIAHIVSVHHGYLRGALPSIGGYLQKLVAVHGERHPELAPIEQRFTAVREELDAHMYKEEHILFPLIEQMERASEGRAPVPAGPPIEAIVHVMESEHVDAGAGLVDMRALSQGYETPADGCTTYGVCYAALAEFESDLHRHIHLENNILFPRAVALDARVRG